MSIAKSKDYESNISARRLFNGLKEEAQQVEKLVDALLVTGNAMRLSMSRALLGIAQIEALYVDQTEARRKVDAELFVVQAQLGELKTKIAPALADAQAGSKNIDALVAAADRTEMDRFIPPQPMGQIEGVTYVDMPYLCAQLATDPKSVRRYITEGRIRPADSQESVPGLKGRVGLKDVWIKSLVDQSINEFLDARKNKRRAAFVG